MPKSEVNKEWRENKTKGSSGEDGEDHGTISLVYGSKRQLKYLTIPYYKDL